MQKQGSRNLVLHKSVLELSRPMAKQWDDPSLHQLLCSIADGAKSCRTLKQKFVFLKIFKMYFNNLMN